MIKSQAENAVAYIAVSHWRSASARADRVMITVMAVIIGLVGTVFGSALMHSSPIVRTVRLMNTIVEYIRVPITPAPVSMRSDSGSEAGMKLLAQHRCLAEALYFEARGEGEKGEMAVAEVIFHRLQGGGYGHSICSVVYEGASKAGCQFSFACDGSRSRPKSAEDWRKAEVMAARILTGELTLSDVTDNAMNYHAVYVRPIWSKKLIRTAQIGDHIFYRLPTGSRAVPELRPSEE